MHEGKGHVLAKPHPYIFFTLQLVHESYLVAIFGNYLQGTHTYMTDALHMHINLAPRPCGRKKVA